MRRKDNGAAIFAAALIVSFALHIGLAASWLYSMSGELGTVDTPIRAISVNLQTTDVLDALESAAANEAASSNAGAMPAAAAHNQQVEIKEKEDKETRPARQAGAGKQPIAGESLQKESTREQSERDEAKRQAEAAARARKAEIEVREKEQQGAIAESTATAGSQEADASTGRISASQGSILNYGARLRAIISAHAPRDIRNRSLTVSLHIAPEGGITEVAVTKSSGDLAADSRVIGLVRKLSAEFPLPPEGAASSLLFYEIEIIFR